MIRKKLFFRFLSFMLLITAFLPVVHENLPFGLGSFRFWWGPLWIISIIFYKKTLFKHPVILRFIIYSIGLMVFMPTIWYNMDEWLKSALLQEMYWMLIISSVLFYYLVSNDYIGLTIMIKVVLVFIAITTVLTIVATKINPFYVRLLTGSGATGFAETREGQFFIHMGAGLYSFGQSLVCILPLLVFLFKKSKSKNKKWWLLYIVVVFVAIVRMQFFANIIVAAVGILMAFIGGKRIKLSIIILIFLFGLAFALPKSNYSQLLINISHHIDKGSENFNKVTEFSSFLNAGNNDDTEIASRIERYPLLLNAFFNNPFFGNANSPDPENIENGYHIHWMGKLGATGIIGIILFLFPHIFFIRSFFKRFNKEYAFYAGISYLTFIILGFMKTIAGRDIWFTYFLIIPGIYYFSLFRNKENEMLVIDH